MKSDSEPILFMEKDKLYYQTNNTNTDVHRSYTHQHGNIDSQNQQDPKTLNYPAPSFFLFRFVMKIEWNFRVFNQIGGGSDLLKLNERLELH